MGLFSKKKTPQSKIHIQGFPGHVDTGKCLYLAAEKGIQIDTDLLDLTGQEHKQDAFLALSPFGKIPCLSDNNLVISGTAAILPYLDIKGAGKSLTPRKAAHLGEQNYWVEVGQNQVLPAVSALLEEHLLSPMTEASYTVNQSRIDEAKNAIKQVYAVADRHLEGKDYFTYDYSFAEIHWVPYLHYCLVAGHADLLEQHAQLKRWFEEMKLRKNGSKLTYDILPNIEQIKGKDLRYAA